jgi:predicted DNA-binding transcriptional regulator AlpA
VLDGRMPRPKRLGGRRRAYDVHELDAAIDQLPTDEDLVATKDETWSDVDAP